MHCTCTIFQGFGGNATATYKNGGMLGHSGIDESCGYGSVINSYFNNEYVYKVLTPEQPSNDGTGFTGVFTIVDDGVQCFEFLYGHCDPIATVGQILPKGGVVGTEANHGEVYAGQERITLAMQKAGDHRGSHRHCQKRLLRKDKNIQPNTHYLTDSNGRFYYNGYYYAIPDYSNGYNGCVNWLLPVLNKNLYPLTTSYDVGILQRFLIKGGYLQSTDTGFFGTLTTKALMAFQKANGISPAPVCGPATRALINSLI
jgi:hypothetical protein